ncbi:MAG: 50S ribosomal protein L11 methyltransferase [Legionellales bacterium]|nr:50S ribosomal protein L11 methyltransferase [Legionellales bacterium]|tara:strand:- start:6275 stop:7156 length:882 start_codon:yes stop_codon:yes gene_type:complete
MNWHQLQFFTHGDDAEHLGDLLFAIGAASVTFQDGGDEPIYEPSADQLLTWQETVVTALFNEAMDIDECLESLGLLWGKKLPHYQQSQLADKDWENEWKRYFKPVKFGNDLWICPSWCEPPEPAATNIILDPGLAFGTGTHPTTAMCLEQLSLMTLTNKTVIDYGCGSGILGIAAHKRGAAQVIGVDNHPQALEASLDNAAKNNINPEQFVIVAPDALPDAQADVLVANILAQPLVGLAARFAELVKPDGKIILSGILHDQLPLIQQAYSPWFSLEETHSEGDWVCLVYLFSH